MTTIRLTIELHEALGDFDAADVANAIIENSNADEVVSEILKKSHDPMDLFSHVLMGMPRDQLEALREELNDELARRNGTVRLWLSAMTLTEALDSPRYALTRMDRPRSWTNDYRQLGATVYLRDDAGFRAAAVRTTVGEVEPLLKERGRTVHGYR